MTGHTTLTSVDGVHLEAAVQPGRGTDPRGTLIYTHGITADMDEFGTAVRIADRLAQHGFTTLRFSFRGHGGSGGTQRGVTIAGQMLDLEAAVEHAESHLPTPLSIVASSFGAVGTLLSLPWLNDRLRRLVLLRPVLDLHRTFVEPETPWGKVNYSATQRTTLDEQGFMIVNGTFQLGRVLFEELHHHDPISRFLTSSVPTLIVQGDQDTIVSHEITHHITALRPHCTLHTITGSDHGFDTPQQQQEATDALADWLTRDLA